MGSLINMFCMKSVVLFFLLNGLEMPSSAKVIYKGMPRVEFPEIFEPIKKMNYPIDIDENDGMIPRVELPERFIKRVMDFPQNINENEESRSGSEDYSKDKFAESFLAEHNKLRAKHGVPPLKLTDKLSKTAQDWAEKLLKENSLDQLDHSPQSRPYQESLWGGDGSLADPKKIIQDWYSESKDYKYDVEIPDKKTFKEKNIGHFTQIVWKSTTELGVGVASKDGKVIVVAHYSPKGNMLGHFIANVLPPKKSG